MELMQINSYLFFGVLELSMVLLILALVFIARSKILSGKIQALQKKLEKAMNMPEPEQAIGYDHYLREEIIRNEALIETSAAAQDQADQDTFELMKMRKQFLELELEVQELEANPVAFSERIEAGMTALIEQLRPEAEMVPEQAPEVPDETAEVNVEEAGEDESSAILDTRDEEFDRLKGLLSNQHDMMSALREELQKHEGEIEEMDALMSKLDAFEKQSAELDTCLQVLEDENERLNAAKGRGELGTVEKESLNTAQLNGFKSMIGDQKETIASLQKDLSALTLEAGAAQQLEQAMAKFERANSELTGCIAVLEEENDKLRQELDTIQAQLEQDAGAVEVAEVAETTETADDAKVVEETEAATTTNGDIEEPEFDELPEPEEGDLNAETTALEIQVQELEALVEFKDAAIEELEKQYNTLEGKYLTLTEEKVSG